MSAHEALGQAYQVMTRDMGGKLGLYMNSLQHRYGDPRAYEAQREEMAAQQAAVIHANVKTREEALSAAYHNNRQAIREAHDIRMQRFARDKPPRYLEVESSGDQIAAPPPASRPELPEASGVLPEGGAR